MNAGPISENDLQAHVDGRLPPARSAQVDAWLAERPADAARIAALRRDRDTLRTVYAPVAAEPVPARLVAVFQRSLNQAWRRAAAAILIFAAGAGAGWAGGYFGRAPAASPAQLDLVRNAVGAHRVFVPEIRHPVEVGASQEAHLVAWLSKRVGHKLEAPDLAAIGFRLMGGRLLAEGAKPAALFMYENAAGQRITIHCVSDPEDATTAFRYREINGVSAFYWIDQKLAYAVIGTVNRTTLLEAARAVYAAYESK